MTSPKFKAIYQALTVLLFLLVSVNMAFAQVYVNGYYRSDGTYVKGHYRTSPDGNPYNNYSFPGNYNPNTGKITGGNKSTYLKNYYDNNSSSGSRVWVDGYYRKDGTYVRGHYRTKPDGIKSNNYSYPGNYNPNTEKATSGSSSYRDHSTKSYSTSYSYNQINYSKLNQQYETSEILRLQKDLRELRYNPGPVDGVLGPKTIKALMLYKSSQNRIPENAIRYGNQWICKNGYKKAGNKCQKIYTPSNAIAIGDDWICRNGYKKVGNTCKKVFVPNNAIAIGDDWVCRNGYKKAGNRCNKIHVPQNAIAVGDRWVCKFGYKKAGNKCVK